MHSETLPLQYPFTHKGEEITQLTIRRPKLGDIKRFEKVKDEMDKATKMLADLAEIAPDVVDQLDMVDFNAASEMIAGFLGVSAEDIRRSSAR